MYSSNKFRSKTSDSGPIFEIKRLDGDMRNERSTDARSSLAQPRLIHRYLQDEYIRSGVITQPSRKSEAVSRSSTREGCALLGQRLGTVRRCRKPLGRATAARTTPDSWR